MDLEAVYSLIRVEQDLLIPVCSNVSRPISAWSTESSV